MVIYIIATLLACGLAWIGSRQERRWPWLVAAAIPLTLVSAIRWDVGTDFYYTYYPSFCTMECVNLGGTEDLIEKFLGPLFERLAGGPIDSVRDLYRNYTHVLAKQEWGFRQLMAFMSWSGLGFRGVVVATSLLVGACVFTAIFRQSRNPVLAIYLYVATSNYFLGLNIIRQYVAIGFALVAVEFVVRRKLLPFLACIAAGMLFHATVVLVVPCYFLCRIPLRPWMGFALVAAALCLSSVAEPVALWSLPKVGLGRYCRYFGSGSSYAKDGFEWFFFAINMSFLAFGAWYWKRAKAQSPHFLVWYNMTLIGTLFLALSGSVPLMKRMNYYFAAPQFLLLPEILLAEGRPLARKALTALAVVAFGLETLVAVWVYNKNEVLPYGVRCRPDHAKMRIPFAKKPFGWRLP